MDMGWSSYEAAQEYTNYHACLRAFQQAHPAHHQDEAEMCDDGCYKCPRCPWNLDFTTTTPLTSPK